ncbi:hypothetical protein ACRQ5Q_08755 [Bradyrhizobium sp. PMVTL-01]
MKNMSAFLQLVWRRLALTFSLTFKVQEIGKAPIAVGAPSNHLNMLMER